MPASCIKVMLIDESSERRDSVARILKSAGCEVVANVHPQQDLIQQVETCKPDMLIIDIELPDRDVLEQLRSIYSNAPKPMVMFSQEDDGVMIRKAIQAGVSAYIVDGINSDRVRSILEAAIATFDQYQLLQQQLDHTQYELDKRNKLEKAKRILIQQRGIDEDSAYKVLRKGAMDKQCKIEDMAQRIIDADALLNG